MINSRTVSGIRLTNLVEYFGPTHDPNIALVEFDPSVIERNRSWLTSDHWYPNVQRLVIAIQIWIVHVNGQVILIDAGVGNLKPRSTARMHMLNTLVPQWLAAADADFHQVTHVVMTHLHSDHVGWNTIKQGDQWVPAFPNARYYIPRADFEYFGEANRADPSRNPSFADSVLPLVNAGRASFIEPGDVIAECLRAVAAPGHTPGQINYWIGDEAVFSADIFHHPLQITEPQLNSVACIQPELARATRLSFLERAADTGALIMPCHFGPPHCGYVRRTPTGFAFEPG